MNFTLVLHLCKLPTGTRSSFNQDSQRDARPPQLLVSIEMIRLSAMCTKGRAQLLSLGSCPNVPTESAQARHSRLGSYCLFRIDHEIVSRPGSGSGRMGWRDQNQPFLI